jgi:transmembrane sensor
MAPSEIDDPSETLLFRYVADQCAAPERLAVERWLRRDAANERRVENIRRIWRVWPPGPTPDMDRLWSRLLDATAHPPVLTSDTTGPGDPIERPVRATGLTRLSRRGFQAAVWAAVLAIFVSGVLLRTRGHTGPAPPVAASPHVYTTGPAQTVHVRLGDGSGVMLAPMSRLSVPDDYGGRERAVMLEGQGFFDVAHNAAMPFRVRAKGAVAEDIGTRFDVRAYPDDPDVVVIVADGAVKFGRARRDTTGRGADGVVVRRGERARLDGVDSATTVDRVSLRMVDWTEGRLSFTRTPLADIARALGRWYGLDVRVNNTMLAQRLVTADFTTQAPRDMVEVLALTVDGAVERHGRVLTIEAKR